MSDRWLVGWKEIAKYIGYSVGTAKKYHYDYRMPVLRKFGKVRADRDELDKFFRITCDIATKTIPIKNENLTKKLRPK